MFRLKVNSSGVRVNSVPSSVIKGKTCGNDHDGAHTHATVINELSVASFETARILTIAAFTDPEWQMQHGANSDAQVAATINAAEAFYANQLNMRLEMARLVNYSETSPETNPSQLLNEFRRQSTTLVPENVKVLFTGKDLDGSTIGIAYIGVVCRAPTYSYNVTQSYASVTHTVLAHELGHNLGAWHDQNAPGSLMYPSISFGNPTFSGYSLGEINAFVDAFGSCIRVDSVPPSLHGATISISKFKRRKIRIILRSVTSELLANRTLQITMNRRSFLRVTSAKGRIILSPGRRRRVTISAVAQDNPNVSKVRRLTF
jgi:hypothetical protein